MGNPSRLSTWKPVLSSIKAKLSTWKRKILTWLGGYVLSFLPLYYMSIFPMLKGIINAISYINHFFFCGMVFQTLMLFARWLGIRSSSVNLLVVLTWDLCTIKTWLCSLNGSKV